MTSPKRAASDMFMAVSLRAADLARQATLRSYRLFVQSGAESPALIEDLSPHAALRAALHARLRVPAYRRLLEECRYEDEPALPAAERVRRLPITDKASYIARFGTEDRCLDGRIPLIGTEIDESSGSSGAPYDWVRGAVELREKRREMGQFTRYSFGTRDLISINAFSMGAWATGINVGEALRENGIVKSTGPDVDKILHTLRFFGPRYTYAVAGYPPFLKHLLDEGDARGFEWSAYRLFGIVAGEGLTEPSRTYLERRFQTVFSGYGASDLDIGVAAELPLTVWIRKQAAANSRLRRALFGDDPRLPMLFQYNPLDYYIETTVDAELVITINRLCMLSPRLRYNIHDAGGVIAFARMLSILHDFGLDPRTVHQRPDQPIFRLPFLYLFGRSDSTISYMGANIYPEDVEEALFSEAGDARRLGAFCLELVDMGAGESRPCVHVEVVDGLAHDVELVERLRARLLEHLLAHNGDFRSAVMEDASAADVRVRLHGAGEGPFAANRTRIKQRYVLPVSARS